MEGEGLSSIGASRHCTARRLIAGVWSGPGDYGRAARLQGGGCKAIIISRGLVTVVLPRAKVVLSREGALVTLPF